jgi:hypothetical protein
MHGMASRDLDLNRRERRASISNVDGDKVMSPHAHRSRWALLDITWKQWDSCGGAMLSCRAFSGWDLRDNESHSIKRSLVYDNQYRSSCKRQLFDDRHCFLKDNEMHSIVKILSRAIKQMNFFNQ